MIQSKLPNGLSSNFQKAHVGRGWTGFSGIIPYQHKTPSPQLSPQYMRKM